MSGRTAITLLLFMLSACSSAAQSIDLPTLAVLPTAPPTAAPPPKHLNFWETTGGMLSRARDVELWQFNARRGDAIIVRVLGRGISVSARLQATDGRTLATGDMLNVTIPADGAYELAVELVDGAAGEYELGLSYANHPSPAVATFTPRPRVVGVPTPTPVFADLGTFSGIFAGGQSAEVAFPAASRPHVYSLEGRAGEFVTVRMERTAGALDPVLNLFAPDGTWLATDDNSGGGRDALLRDVRLPRDGLYSVQALAENPPGRYRISLTLAAQPAPITPWPVIQPTATRLPAPARPTLAPAARDMRLQDHVPVRGSLRRAGLFDRYLIAVEEGDIITVNVRPAADSALRPRVEVFGVGGELLALATLSDDGEALIRGLPVLATGNHVIFITAEDNRGTGDYVVAYGHGTTVDERLRGGALPGQPNDGALEHGTSRDVWDLFLNEGEMIRIDVEAAGGAFEPNLELVGTDGAPLALDDNSGSGATAAIPRATVPVTGRYRLHVDAARGVGGGPYTLIWRYLSRAPTPTPQPAGVLLFSVDDVADEQAYQFYPFQGRAGQRVRISTTALDDSGFDPVVALLDPQGAVIVEVDDSAGGLNPRFEAELPVDGTYLVRVNGYGTSSGSFDLRVELLPG